MRAKPWVICSVIPAILGACEGTIDPGSRPGPAAVSGSAGSSPGQSAGSPSTTPGSIDPGRVVAHRLNRVEYDNTVRDLFGLDSQLSSQFGFPDDNYVEGFDNNAQSLTASPLLLEKYQAAAESIVTRALDTAPSNQTVRSRIMICDPASAGVMPCATSILTAFATRAFRRPVTSAEIAPYAGLLATAQTLGDGFEQGIATALQAMLLSPKFVFRVEHNPGQGQVGALDGYELASRLSYFIWSSMPDAELMARAADGGLGQPDELRRQVARLVADPKATALVDNLAGQWLASRELAVKEITLAGFVLDDGLRASIAQETSLFLRELLQGDQPVRALLGADFTFLDRSLAMHYGLPEASTLDSGLRKVALTDPKRGAGLLTQANFLLVHSQRDRTSPTRRGKWISENMLCVAVPPPPPKIPELVPNDQKMPTSTRERLEAHRRKGSTCEGCHQYMDPLGLPLEHYDTVGRYRETDDGAAIDATGEIPTTSVTFDGALDLASALEADPRFLSCVIKKFLTYALGRSVAPNAPGDMAAVAAIESQLHAEGDRLSALVGLVAQSPLMTMRTGEL